MQSDNLALAQLGWGVLQFLITAAVWLYAWGVSRDRARKDDLEALRTAHDERIRKTETGLQELRSRVEHLPDADDILGLSNSIAGLAAEVKGVVDLIKGVDRRTNRIEDFLSARAASL